MEEERIYKEGKWWTRRRGELLGLAAKEGTPLYIYDEQTIINQINTLKQTMSPAPITRFFYSIKANSHALLLKTVYEQGLGFECVSVNEVLLIFRLFPNISPKKILYTPNFVPVSDYIIPLQLGVNVTLDSPYPLYNPPSPNFFSNSSIFLRIDPLLPDYGHHSHVSTSGQTSKFGIPFSSIPSLLPLLEKYSINVIGLHAHIGSGLLLPPFPYDMIVTKLFSLLPMFPNVQFVDIGGGLGVPLTTEDPIPLKSIAESINTVVQNWKEGEGKDRKLPELWMEPGRFIVADSGVLLTSVTQCKDKYIEEGEGRTSTMGNYRYIGVDTGFNTLLRPILYDGFHTIVNLTKFGGPGGDPNGGEWEEGDVVGCICESGDVMGRRRRLRKAEAGDVLLIDVVGAYGRAMSLMDYNQRTPAREIVLKRKKASKI
eukprot:TRINITY_DN5114_c0_g1_i2.p1 TRINITY_DN5114_c0_g1~~TRINITY_DN5114_c0_g1_i2.p1  ORF type:complete len:428 (+),score=103.76 TRINITY_DN5114_c0_g1_i2:86-1369(+)